MSTESQAAVWVSPSLPLSRCFPHSQLCVAPQHILSMIWLKFKESKSLISAPLPFPISALSHSVTAGIWHLLVSQTYGCQNSCACVPATVGAVRTAVGLSRWLPVINKGACWEMRGPTDRRSSRCWKFIFGFYVHYMCKCIPACTSEISFAVHCLRMWTFFWD